MKDSVMIDGVEYVRKPSSEEQENIETQREENPYWPWKIGEKYMIRNVTFHYTGILVGVTDNELVFNHAAWIADSGRWYDFIIGKAKPNEVEPYDPNRLVILGRGALSDGTTIDEIYEVQK